MHSYRYLLAVLTVVGLGWGEASAAPCPPAGPALQEQAIFLGSEDYYEAHGGNPREFVAALFADVLRRQPTEAESRRWVSHLAECGNGVTLARQFLIFAQGEFAARAQSLPPPILVRPVYLAPGWRPMPPPPPAGAHPCPACDRTSGPGCRP